MRHRPRPHPRTTTATVAAAIAVALVATTAPAQAAPLPDDLPTDLSATGAADPATGSPAAADPADDPADDPATDPQKAADDGLGGKDQQLLDEAEAIDAETVTVILLTEETGDAGATDEVTGQVEDLGGTVTTAVDEVGYVRAAVPTGNVARVAKLPGVAAIDLDEVIPLPDPAPDQGPAGAAAATPTGVAAPGPDTPAGNAFMPTDETGSVAFKAANPEWDGRGVTIGIVDSGVSLDHPALQQTSTGERKIVDWVTATDPLFDGDPTWRPMLTAVTGPTFDYAGRTWTAPAGEYFVNRFSEAITTASQPAGDVNRDGDTTDTWGVLYDPATNDVWVDVDQDGDFTDEQLMRPYRERFDVNHFGADDPSTPVLDRIPFVVEFREDVDLSPAGLAGRTADFVNIGIAENRHGSHVAGIAAANDMFGNAVFDGQAPGATLISSRACSWGGGCTAAALTDGLVELVVNRGVDIVNISIGGLPALNDGNNARARLYDRLINDFGVQLFISAGNSGPGLNTVGDPSVATDALSVAAGVSRQSWLANYGSVVADELALFPFSSRGPREDGGFKPQLTAPGSAVSTIDPYLAGEPVPQAGYDLPPGYGMLNGTSMSSPQAAGAAALLLSAARAQDRAVTPAQLRRALITSADFEADIAAAGQGNGFIDVVGAWDLLAQNPETRGYTTSAPVCTVISGFLATPDRGTGIYNDCPADAGGHAPGQLRRYEVTLTRTSGAPGRIRHDITWLGDDGTFRAPRRVSLPLNVPVTVTVRARPTAGAHSAVMRVDDPATPVVDHEVLTTVVAGTEPAAPGYGVTVSGSVQRNGTTSYFVTVPEGTPALQVNMTGIAAGSQVRWAAYNPYGVPVDPRATTQCYPNFSDATACNPTSRSYENPLPGVWEIIVEARRTSPSLDNPYSLSARLQGVTVEPGVVDLPSVSAGTATPVTWTVTNDFGPVPVRATGGPLGSSLSQRPSIADAESLTYTVEVPEGAARLDVTIGNPSDVGADLDLFVRKDGVTLGQSADGDSEESVSIASPAPGTYEVEVDGYAVPAGTTEFDYVDVFYSATLGTLDVPGEPVALPAGGSAEITGTVTASAAPAEGRLLFGEMTVVTDEGFVLDDGAVVGRGAVRIGAVE